MQEHDAIMARAYKAVDDLEARLPAGVDLFDARTWDGLREVYGSVCEEAQTYLKKGISKIKCDRDECVRKYRQLLVAEIEEKYYSEYKGVDFPLIAIIKKDTFNKLVKAGLLREEQREAYFMAIPDSADRCGEDRTYNPKDAARHRLYCSPLKISHLKISPELKQELDQKRAAAMDETITKEVAVFLTGYFEQLHNLHLAAIRPENEIECDGSKKLIEAYYNAMVHISPITGGDLTEYPMSHNPFVTRWLGKKEREEIGDFIPALPALFRKS